MNSRKTQFIIFLTIVAVFSLSGFYYFKDSFRKRNPESASLISLENEKEEMIKFVEKPKTIIFAGDIMLDRGVESLIKKNGNLWPFEKISPHFSKGDIVFGNLEGPIVKNPPDFGDHSLQFAFSPDVIDGLTFANFNLLSLANNHTENMGEEGLKETKELLAKANIDFLGHPANCNENLLIDKEDIIFLAFNKTFSFNCSDEEILEIIKKTKNLNPNKFLVVIFHWGNEYEMTSSKNQKDLARKSIDAGANLIIGSHPHVVQEIEEYKDSLIFYSLGNFIFDQYFSKETQEGLAVELKLYQNKEIFQLFPIQIETSQASLMDPGKTYYFLEELAEKSSPQLLEEIKNGVIEIKR